MKRKEAIEFLKGRTIEDISYGEYLGWFVIDSIKFTDGVILELGGNADCARIDDIILPDGSCLNIEED